MNSDELPMPSPSPSEEMQRKRKKITDLEDDIKELQELNEHEKFLAQQKKQLMDEVIGSSLTTWISLLNFLVYSRWLRNLKIRNLKIKYLGEEEDEKGGKGALGRNKKRIIVVIK